VNGIGAESVADVDHRPRARRRDRASLAQPRNRIELAREQRVALIRRQTRRLRAVEQLDRGCPASEVTGHRQHVPRSGAGAGHQSRPPGLVADCGDRDDQHGRGDQVPARDRDRFALGDLDESVDDSEQLVVAEVGRGADDRVGLALGRSHRGQVGECGGERLPAGGLGAKAVEPEVDTIHDRVDGDRARSPRLDDGGVVAARQLDPWAGGREPLRDRGDQVEFAL